MTPAASLSPSLAVINLVMNSTTRPAIDRLLRGVSTDHVETVRDAWRDLLREGSDSVGVVQGKLASTAWSEIPRGPVAKYFGVLLAILDELDKTVFEREVARLRKSKLHPMHAQTLNILSRRILDEPASHVGDAIPVYIASDVSDRPIVLGDIERWSRIRGLSLENVTRIDVIARHPQLDYLGKYNLFFSGIVLTWPVEPGRGMRLWWHRLNAEFTFYHEVGHHVLGHIEGGQVKEQEREADEYARSMMRNSRPVLTTIGRLLSLPLKPLLRRVTASV